MSLIKGFRFSEKQDIEIHTGDAKGRAVDDIFIGRFWRTRKCDSVYLHPASDDLELYQEIKELINYYKQKKDVSIETPFLVNQLTITTN